MFRVQYKSRTGMRILNQEGEPICPGILKQRNIFELLEQAFYHYQEHRIKEIGEEAFVREVFEILTKNMKGETGREKKETCKKLMELLGLKIGEPKGAPSMSNHGYTTLTPPPDYDGILPTYSTIEESSSEPAESRRAPEERQPAQPDRKQETGQKASQTVEQTEKPKAESKGKKKKEFDTDEFLLRTGLAKYLVARTKPKKKDEQDFD